MDSVRLAAARFILASMTLADVPSDVRKRLFPRLGPSMKIGELHALIRERLKPEEEAFFRSLGIPSDWSEEVPVAAACPIIPSATAPSNDSSFWLEERDNGQSGALCFEGGYVGFTGQPWNLLVLLARAGSAPVPITVLQADLGLTSEPTARALLGRVKEAIRSCSSLRVIETITKQGYQLNFHQYRGGLEALASFVEGLSVKS